MKRKNKVVSTLTDYLVMTLGVLFVTVAWD